MSEHTKEKWEVMLHTRRDGNNIRWVEAVRGKRHISICQTFKPCAEDHAYLIAAAPDLLTACKRLHSCLLAACSYPQCIDVAKHWQLELLTAEAAIDKAKPKQKIKGQ